jgi:hypothetical protein
MSPQVRVTYVNLSKGLDFQKMASMTYERLTLIKLRREEEEGHISQPDPCETLYSRQVNIYGPVPLTCFLPNLKPAWHLGSSLAPTNVDVVQCVVANPGHGTLLLGVSMALLWNMNIADLSSRPSLEEGILLRKILRCSSMSVLKRRHRARVESAVGVSL